MVTIRLNKLILFGYHGVHQEESILGNEFEVNVSVSFIDTTTIEELHQTINYVTIYEIIKTQFLTPVKLLETLAQTITQEIHKSDNRITSINISIDKINAPISNFIGTVGVSYSKSYY